MKATVEEQWKWLNKLIYDGSPPEGYIAQFEQVFVTRQTQIDTGALAAGFDWSGDLAAAKALHESNKTWVARHTLTRESLIEWWEKEITRKQDYVEKLGFGGINLVIAFHGAVALGALKVLSEKPGDPLLLLTAKFAICSSLIGIFLIGVGKIVIIEYTNKFISRIRGKLVSYMRYKKLRALGRYYRKMNPFSQWGTRLIYASFAWFFIYTVVCGILLMAL